LAIFFSDTRDGFDAELSSYGQGGRVIGPVVGAFGLMPNDVKRSVPVEVMSRMREKEKTKQKERKKSSGAPRST
jgi:hypothetical protein